MSDKEIQKKQGGKSRFFRIVFFVFLFFLVSAISSVVTDKYIFPWIATRHWFENRDFFKKAMENVTVINKTEQITVSESGDVSSYIEKSASSVVEIVSKQEEGKNESPLISRSVSGIVVTADGLVASCGEKFFDEKNANYKVFLSDGKSFDAYIAAKDSFSGIVLLKMENAQNLPVAEYIAAEDIKIGMKTVFIGRNGFNSEIALKFGIISQKAKSFSLSGPLASSEKLQGTLFASLDSVSSNENFFVGGASVSPRGHVIGVLGEKKEGPNTVFFIVTIDHLRYVVDEFLAKGKIERGSLGVYYIPFSKETGYLFGSNQERGALVYSQSGQQGLAVIGGSAADKAGIKIGDTILSVNGEEVNPDQSLAYLISKYKPGDKVTLRISRNGQEMEIPVILN